MSRPQADPEPGGVRMLAALGREIIGCRQCPRLGEHLAEIARTKKREFRDCSYWGRPLPGFGDARARLLIVGLAPAAHGGARTGRMFTGDSSGAFLMAALHRAGFASQPSSLTRDDGLELLSAYITAAARCAPPANRPLPIELERCRPYLVRELRLLAGLRVLVALGHIAFDAVVAAAPEADFCVPKPRPRFVHGGAYRLQRPGRPLALLASYHPSRQNTNTGRLTPPMFDRVFARARRLVDSPG